MPEGCSTPRLVLACVSQPSGLILTRVGTWERGGAQQLQGQVGFMVCLGANVGGLTFRKALAEAPSPPPPCTPQAAMDFSSPPTPSSCPRIGLVNVPKPTQSSWGPPRPGQPCPGVSPSGAAE